MRSPLFDVNTSTATVYPITFLLLLLQVFLLHETGLPMSMLCFSHVFTPECCCSRLCLYYASVWFSPPPGTRQSRTKMEMETICGLLIRATSYKLMFISWAARPFPIRMYLATALAYLGCHVSSCYSGLV